MKASPRLQTLVQEGLIDTVVRQARTRCRLGITELDALDRMATAV